MYSLFRLGGWHADGFQRDAECARVRGALFGFFGEALFEHFTRTRAIRRGIVEIGQDSAAPDFGRPHAQLDKKVE